MREIIGKYFDYTFDFDFIELVQEIFERLEDMQNDDSIYDEIDYQLSWYKNQWFVAMFYNGSPSKMDWNETLEEFISDIFVLRDKIINK